MTSGDVARDVRAQGTGKLARLPSDWIRALSTATMRRAMNASEAMDPISLRIAAPSAFYFR